MGSDWVVLVAGWLFVVVMAAPLWLERWTKDDGRSTPCLWEEEA